MGKPKEYTNKASRNMVELIAINEALPCEIKGCDRHRHGLNKLCGTHYRSKLYYGSPHGCKISPKRMGPERTLATHIVQQNADNELIKKGIEYFDRWLSNAQACTPSTLGIKHMQRLVNEGATGEILFIEAITLMIWNTRYPGYIPDDVPEPFQIALALQVLCYKYSEKFGVDHSNQIAIAIRLRRDVGREIWYSLGESLVKIASAVEDRDAQRKPQVTSSKSLVIHN